MSDESEPDGPTRVHLELEDGYRFLADFGAALPVLAMDEPAPLGEGSGPDASAVLGAAVGYCLSASLLFCLRKAHVDVGGMSTDVDVTTARNERGRLRVGSIRVQLHPEVAALTEGGARRCPDLFEDFCVVTEAVRNGIGVDVSVTPGGRPAGQEEPPFRQEEPLPPG